MQISNCCKCLSRGRYFVLFPSLDNSTIISPIFAGCFSIHPNRGRSAFQSQFTLISGSNLCRIEFTCMQNALVKLVMFRNKHYIFCSYNEKRNWPSGAVLQISDNQTTKFQVYTTPVLCLIILLSKSKALNPYLLINCFYSKSHQICA